LRDFVEELTAENNEKNSAIAKASKVIESLRYEVNPQKHS